MSAEEVVRAWKDPDYRDAPGLDHPAGQIELTDAPRGGVANTTATIVYDITVMFDCWETYNYYTCGVEAPTQCA